MKYFFETYGCQMNIAESAALENYLIDTGWTKAESEKDTDLLVINTCSVRITAEERIEGRLGNLKTVKQSHPMTIVVTGCMAERLKGKLKERFPQVDYIMGNFQKKYFPDIVRACEKGLKIESINEDEAYNFSDFSWTPGTFSSYLPIMHGCNNFCSYCIVPYVRGREISRKPEEILEEIRLLEGKKVKEVTLLGQNVNSYNYGGLDFPGLLKLVIPELKGIKWLRFLSSHPKDVSPELIELLGQEEVLCRHLHLPVQHGSNRILAAMNRKYTREQYIALVNRIREACPDISLSTDILIGFPGETESDLEETLSLMETVKFEYAYMYHYNPREGTKAFELPNRIPEPEKIRRLDKVIKLQHKITGEVQKNRLYREVPVLVESVSRDNPQELLGRTGRDSRVVFKGPKDLIGDFVNVRLEEIKGFTYRGTLMEN